MGRKVNVIGVDMIKFSKPGASEDYNVMASKAILVPEEKPVVLRHHDEIFLGGARYRVHVHGTTTEVLPPRRVRALPRVITLAAAMASMRWLGLLLVVACSTGPAADDAGDARTESSSGTPCRGSPVSGKCAVEGATACGISAWCTDVWLDGEVTCTCRNGIWDCDKCRDCNLDLRSPPRCSLCDRCQGGSATRPDGVSTPVVECKCACAMFDSNWVCTDFQGQDWHGIPREAGPDGEGG